MFMQTSSWVLAWVMHHGWVLTLMKNGYTIGLL